MENSTLSKEVQHHGFSWEKDILRNVFQVSDEEIKQINYTSKMDLPSAYNRVDHVDVSIKTSCSANAVCMADCLRIYDAVASGNPFHLLVVHYKQDDSTNTKKLTGIVQVDLTNTVSLLFGTITREEISTLDKVIKEVPQKRKPTEEEYDKIYTLRNELQKKSGALHLDPKCNSQQSRLQCSFNRFQEFLQKNPTKIIAQSQTNQFRGANLLSEIQSSRRVFKKNQIQN